MGDKSRTKEVITAEAGPPLGFEVPPPSLGPTVVRLVQIIGEMEGVIHQLRARVHILKRTIDGLTTTALRLARKAGTEEEVNSQIAQLTEELKEVEELLLEVVKVAAVIAVIIALF